jgi:hypothetical protein
MHVANQPAPVHITHDVLHRAESLGGAGFVVHGQEDAAEQLNHQHQKRQRTEEVPDVKVIGREVFGDMIFPELREGKTRVDPVHYTVIGSSRHYATSLPPETPISIRVSLRYLYGGTSKLIGAGTLLNTRPAKSKREPWQGQKNPPTPSRLADGCGT